MWFKLIKFTVSVWISFKTSINVYIYILGCGNSKLLIKFVLERFACMVVRWMLELFSVYKWEEKSNPLTSKLQTYVGTCYFKMFGTNYTFITCPLGCN